MMSCSSLSPSLSSCPTQLSPAQPRHKTPPGQSTPTATLLSSKEPREDQLPAQREGAQNKCERGRDSQPRGKIKKQPDYRDRNADVCPEAPNLCAGNRYGKKVSSMSHAKTKNACACVSGKSCQTRLLESLLYRTCRPLPSRRWPAERDTLAGLPASNSPRHKGCLLTQQDAR